MIELGGELRASGRKPDCKLQKIGIEGVDDEDFTPH